MAARKKTTTPSWRTDLDAILTAFTSLRALAPSAPASAPPLRKWDEDALAAFEKRLGAPLPPAVRAYAIEIGTGGAGFPTAGIRSFDELVVTPAAKKPFPLTTAWSDPSTVGEWKAEGQYVKNKARFYALPKGAKPTDGCVVLGATSDHSLLLLVLTGESAGSVWIDSTGVDLGGVDPAEPREFLALQRAWIEGELARAEREAELVAAAKSGKLDALGAKAKDKKAFSKELATIGFRLLGSTDAPTRALGLTFVRKTNDECKLACALLETRAWEELVATSRPLMEDASAHDSIKARAAIHLVIALAALHARDELSALRLPNNLAYYFPYKDTTSAALFGLELERRRLAFAKLPGSLVLDLAKGAVADEELAPLLDGLLHEGFRDLPGENAARDAAVELVSNLGAREAPLPAAIADGLARVLAYVGRDDNTFDELAAASKGHFSDGAEARRTAVAWLLGHRAELLGPNTDWAGPRFDELSREGR